MIDLKDYFWVSLDYYHNGLAIIIVAIAIS
jgi:hypothetical protein